MAWFTMLVIYLRLLLAGLIPSQHWLDPARILWVDVAHAIHLHRVLLISSASRTVYLMTRPRGRPRRGSPWKPRRPSVMPPDSPSICSSPRLQSEFFSASSHVPPNAQFNCLAIIPRSPNSLLRHFQDPPVNPSAPTPVLDPLGNLGCEPSPHRAPRKAGHHFTDSFNSAQFRDSLAILHDLVFELRQGVEDLHFRLQATDEKVAICLQTLSSMHEALSSDLAETTPMEEPTAATGEGQDKA
jgi:hypothetical protein